MHYHFPTVNCPSSGPESLEKSASVGFQVWILKFSPQSWPGLVWQAPGSADWGVISQTQGWSRSGFQYTVDLWVGLSVNTCPPTPHLSLLSPDNNVQASRLLKWPGRSTRKYQRNETSEVIQDLNKLNGLTYLSQMKILHIPFRQLQIFNWSFNNSSRNYFA